MSVTLTSVPVSPTRCTQNWSTILSEDDPDNQEFDCKNMVWRFLYYILSLLQHLKKTKKTKTKTKHMYMKVNSIKKVFYIHENTNYTYTFNTNLSTMSLKIPQEIYTYRFNFTQWIHTDNNFWPVVNKQPQEVQGVLWWRIMRHNNGVVLKVGLWNI